VGQRLFGASTCGMAAGNSVLEASLRALAELIERDIWSFEQVRRASTMVDPATLPEAVREFAGRAKENGLCLAVRSVPNDYGLPFFAAFLFDPEVCSRKFFNGGWGCHLGPFVALAQAVTEAAQSRLAFLHGERKISEEAGDARSRGQKADEQELLQNQIRELSNPAQSISFGDLQDSSVCGSQQDQSVSLIKHLRRATERPIYRIVYTPPRSSLHVVRLIVPLLEDFTTNSPRVGRRLRSALQTPLP
jgi:ribosomal protein S12 methylthiotransferase accessory factor